MLIKSLRLSNFLSYGQEIHIPLAPLNILIGTNGSGKSNLIEAIDLLHNAPTDLLRPIRDGGGINDWLWKGQEDVIPEAAIDTVFAYRDYSGSERDLRHVMAFSAVGQRFEIKDERVEDAQPLSGHEEPYFYYHFNAGRPYLNILDEKRYLQTEDVDFEKSILSQRKDPEQYPEITWLGKQLDNICIYRDWNFGRYTPPRTPQRTDLPNLYLASDCSNLGLVLNKIDLKTSVKRKVLDILKDINPDVEDFSTHIVGNTVQVFLQEKNMAIPATRLSDGLLRFICLAAILCNPDLPALICIEEPELGLHPDIISTLASLLKEAALKTQLVVTTHSAMLVDYFTDEPESVIVAEKNEAGTSLKHLDRAELEPWLKEYRLGKLWLQGELGGTRW